MQYSPQYLIQAKNKLKVYSDSMVYCQNRYVATAVSRNVSVNQNSNGKKIMDTVFIQKVSFHIYMQICNYKKSFFFYMQYLQHISASYRNSSFHLLYFKLKCVSFSRKSILALNSIRVWVVCLESNTSTMNLRLNMNTSPQLKICRSI